jgi:hypothetical protein
MEQKEKARRRANGNKKDKEMKRKAGKLNKNGREGK